MPPPQPAERRPWHLSGRWPDRVHRRPGQRPTTSDEGDRDGCATRQADHNVPPHGRIDHAEATTAAGPDRGLAGHAPPRSESDPLGVGHPHRAGAGRSPSPPDRRPAQRPDPPPSHPSRPMPHLPPLCLAPPVAPPSLSLPGVAPDPQRTDRRVRPRHDLSPTRSHTLTVLTCPTGGQPRGHPA